MLIDDVKQLHSQERFYYWIQERQNILKKKLNGEEILTDDVIFQKYHFTNVRREDDRVSKWLLDNLYSKSLTNHFGLILISRFINNPDSLNLIKDELLVCDYKSAKEKLQIMSDSNMTIFRSAYLQPEMKGVSRLDKIFDHLLPKVLYADISTNSLRESITDLCKIKYLGEFISGQMAMDALMFVYGLWADANTYAPKGPGSVRGLNRFLEQKLTKGIDNVDYIAYLLVLAEEANVRALDIEHSLCEWDKYERILWSDGTYNRYYKK